LPPAAEEAGDAPQLHLRAIQAEHRRLARVPRATALYGSGGALAAEPRLPRVSASR
jgi:hypothetical protein